MKLVRQDFIEFFLLVKEIVEKQYMIFNANDGDENSPRFFLSQLGFKFLKKNQDTLVGVYEDNETRIELTFKYNKYVISYFLVSYSVTHGNHKAEGKNENVNIYLDYEKGMLVFRFGNYPFTFNFNNEEIKTDVIIFDFRDKRLLVPSVKLSKKVKVEGKWKTVSFNYESETTVRVELSELGLAVFILFPITLEIEGVNEESTITYTLEVDPSFKVPALMVVNGEVVTFLSHDRLVLNGQNFNLFGISDKLWFDALSFEFNNNNLTKTLIKTEKTMFNVSHNTQSFLLLTRNELKLVSTIDSIEISIEEGSYFLF